jgi:hypothetical protein
MPLQEVVILNPRRKAKRRKATSRTRKSTTRRTSKARRSTTKRGSKMARRKATTKRRKTTARRKTTTRRRAPARRRKTTTRRRKTTKRRAAPKRRRTTRRRKTVKRRAAPKRRRTTRRKSPAKRRKTTRRRKSPAKRRKTTRRRTTRRRKSPARRRTTRRRTTRRKSPARRRTTRRRTVKRRGTARRRSGVRGLFGMKRSKASAKGFKSFVKSHLVGRTLAVTALGLALPAMSMYLAARTNLGSMVARVPLVGTVMGNAYGRAALGGLLTAGISYGLINFGLLGRNEAIMANSIALVMFLGNAMRQSGHLPGMIANSSAAAAVTVDDSALFGYGGSYMSGYNGYLGYLGSETDDEETASGELFGYNSAPSVNVF